jgi:multiple sugar transport system permease protein
VSALRTAAAEPLGPGPDLIEVQYRRVSSAAIVVNVVLVALGAAFVLPLLWMLFASVDTSPGWAIKLPHHLTTSHFHSVVARGGLHSFVNSLYLAGMTTVITTVVAALAAYPLSRRHIPLRRTFLFAILFAAGLPVTMLLVPVYQLYVKFGWLNSLFTTSLFLAATSLPFGIWLMKNFIDAVPGELEQAAELEGCGTFQKLVRVVVPLALPGISVTAIYTFINAWGAFLVPLVLDSNPNDQPGPITIYNFMGSHGFFDFGQLAAFSLMFSLPVIVLYLVMSRFFSGAFTFGGAIQG